MNFVARHVFAFLLTLMLTMSACSSNDPFRSVVNTPTPVAPLSGDSTVGLLQFSSQTIAFGGRSLNSVDVIQVDAKNNGALNVTNFAVTGYTSPIGYQNGSVLNGANPCGALLAPGATCSFRITFLPVSLAAVSQTLSVTYNNGVQNTSAPLTVTGSGSNVVNLQIIDPNNQFSTLTTLPAIVSGAASTSYTFTVKYTGASTTNGAGGVEFNSVLAPLTWTTTCPDEVTSDCSVTVNLVSSVVGSNQQPLTVTYDNYAQSANSTQNIAYSVIQGDLAFQAQGGGNPNSSFGQQIVNQTFTRIYQVVNAGLTPSSLVSGAVTTNSNSVGSSFAFTGTSNAFPGTNGTCSVGMTLNPNASCLVEVVYTTGATASANTVSGAISLVYSNGISNQTATLALSGSSGNPANVTLSLASYDFGVVTINRSTSPTTFTLTNAANSLPANLTFGTTLKEFPLNTNTSNNCVSALSGGSSCTFTVGFSPDYDNNGTSNQAFSESLSIQVADAVTSRSPLSLSLTGQGNPAAVLVLSPTSLSFSQVVGTSSTQTINVSYYGSQPAQNVAVGGLSGYFSSTTTCGASVSANCKISVTYAPTQTDSADKQTLTLNYSNGVTSALVSPPLTVNVTGATYVPPPPTVSLSFSPSTWEFGNLKLNTASTAQGFKASISNATSVNITSANFTLPTGQTVNPFSLQAPVTGSFANGSSINVIANVPQRGAYQATLTVNFTSGTQTGSASITLKAESYASVAVSGTGAFSPISFPQKVPGSQPATPSETLVFTLKNTGYTAPAALSLAACSSASAPFSFTTTCSASALTPNQSCNVTVTFAPTAPANNYSDSFCFTYDDGRGSASASLSSLNVSGSATVPNLIAAGGNHTCAYANGQLYCWGDNSRGELGLGTTTPEGTTTNQFSLSNLVVPLTLASNEWLVQLALGGLHTCALSNLGNVYCFGANDYGQLGNGNNTGDAISVGDQEGEVAKITPVNLGTGKTGLFLAAGYTHTCVIRNTHDLVCFGNNNFGQLGIGSTTNIGGASAQMGDSLVPVPLGQNVVAVALDTGHSGALLQDGTVKFWGYNNYGQLGQGNQATVGIQAGQVAALPAVNLGTGRTAASIVTGGAFSGIVDNSGQMEFWGHNYDALLGEQYCTNGVPTFGNCANASEFPTAIGGYGDNSAEMGDGLTPVNIGNQVKVDQLAAGNNFNCAITENSSATKGIQCWGANDAGQLGNGSSNPFLDPSQSGTNFPTLNLNGAVPAPSVVLGSVVVGNSLVVGDSHACVLTNAGAVLCWGNNEFGQLGLGNTTASFNTPQATFLFP